LVGNLKKEISHLKSNLEEKVRYLISLKYEKNKLVDPYRKVVDEQKKNIQRRTIISCKSDKEKRRRYLTC
jgi:hypothetical protein